MEKCCLYSIAGRVQGVWYRYGAQKAAKKHEIKGWVKNERDGTVLIMGCGKEENLADFEKWLYKGPMFAKVKSVKIKPIANQNFSDFEIL